MRKAASATLVVVGLVLGGLNGCTSTRASTVSAATIAQLPPGTTFDVDLTKRGTVYRFDDAGTDFSRVAVRTTEGVKNFADLLQGSDTSLRGGVVLGTPADMRDHLPTSTDVASEHDCGVFCKCTGAFDCFDLIVSGKCGGEFWCSEVTDNCFCVAKP